MKQLKIKYIVRYSLRTVIWLAVFAMAYFLYQKYVDIDYLFWLDPVIENKPLMLIIFFTSEVLIGIFPPEVFIIWALREEVIRFMILVGVLSVMSYTAGIIGYGIGHYLKTTKFYRFLKRRFLRRLDRRLQSFGIYLIVIAALTPLPFSGVCMLIGSVDFPFRRFALFALTRFIRFIGYAWIFWYINPNS